jgi:choline dehydrogenase-like flavoprotein
VSFTLYPYSRGHLHITGPKIDDAVDFDPGLLSDPKGLDVKNHVWMYKKQREISRHMGLCQGPVPGTQPTFPPNSKANSDGSNVEYSAEDDEIIEKWVHEHVDSTWHPIGTCKMAPRDKLGVVDPFLSVYGVQRLKVADLSISPHNIGANTCNTAMTIAEKAADMFIQELGLSRK